MPRKAKILTIAVLWASLLFSLYRVDSWLVDAILLMVGIGVTALLVRLQTVGQHGTQGHREWTVHTYLPRSVVLIL